MNEVREDIGEVVEKQEQKKPTTDQIHQALKTQEAREADMDELIPIGNIEEKDVEFSILTERGVSEEDIKKGSVKRGDLLKAGFVFNNYPLGHLMEKPLIKGEVNGTNFTQRKLLTQEELDSVVAFQRQHPDTFIPEEVDVDDLREDMLRFMLTAEDPRPLEDTDPVNTLRKVKSRISSPLIHSREVLEEWENTPEAKTAKLDQELFNLFWEELETGEIEKTGVSKSDFDPTGLEKRFMTENCRDIYPWDELNLFSGAIVRGKEISTSMSTVESRKNALNNTPSPFLDSGFHFPSELEVGGQIVPLGNPDYTVGEGNGVFRVNMMVYHLLSRGVSEMGDSAGKSYDQDYTVGHFIKELYTDPDRSDIRANEEDKLAASLDFDKNELVLDLRRRLVEISREWAEADEAPREAKKILNKVKKAEGGNGSFFGFLRRN